MVTEVVTRTALSYLPSSAEVFIHFITLCSSFVRTLKTISTAVIQRLLSNRQIFKQKYALVSAASAFDINADLTLCLIHACVTSKRNKLVDSEKLNLI